MVYLINKCEGDGVYKKDYNVVIINIYILLAYFFYSLEENLKALAILF